MTEGVRYNKGICVFRPLRGKDFLHTRCPPKSSEISPWFKAELVTVSFDAATGPLPILCIFPEFRGIRPENPFVRRSTGPRGSSAARR